MQVDVTHCGSQIKSQMIELYEAKTGEKLDVNQILLRNPNFDIGQLIKDSDKVENMYLFDGKELYLQKWDASNCISYSKTEEVL